MMDSVDGPFRLQQIGLCGISTSSTLDSIAGAFGLEQLGLSGVSTSSTMDSIAGAFGLVQFAVYFYQGWANDSSLMIWHKQHQLASVLIPLHSVIMF